LEGSVFEGVRLFYKNIIWTPEFHYQLVPLMRKEKKYYFKNTFTFTMPYIAVDLVNSYGKYDWHEQLDASAVMDTFTQGVNFNLFLVDSGITRGTAVSSQKIDYIPSQTYLAYSARIDVPLTFSLYHYDISAMLSLLGLI
jgi:hypothetical protein